MKWVITALKWSYVQQEADVASKHLKAAAELLTLRRKKIQIIDAKNNRFKEEQEEPKSKDKKAKDPKKQARSDESQNPSPK